DERFWQRGTEGGEHVEIGDQSGSLIHILAVLARPKKRFTLGVLESRKVDLAAAKNSLIFGGEILAHHSDQAHRCEVAGGKREVGAGATEGAVNLAEWRFYSIKRDRP